jgi:hypothetical protein
MATTINTTQAILGAAIVEILNGRLTDETIAAVDTIKREEVEGLLENLVGYMHGMSTYEPLRESQITSLIMEIRGVATEMLEQRMKHPNPFSGDWLVMSDVLDTIFGESERDLRAEADLDVEMGGEPRDLNRIPAWTRPLVEHIRTSKASGDELHLELLDVLEAQIQKRRAELKSAK